MIKTTIFNFLIKSIICGFNFNMKLQKKIQKGYIKSSHLDFDSFDVQSFQLLHNPLSSNMSPIIALRRTTKHEHHRSVEASYRNFECCKKWQNHCKRWWKGSKGQEKAYKLLHQTNWSLLEQVTYHKVTSISFL